MKSTRERALDKYYQNPNTCNYCQEVIQVKPKERIHDVRRRKFCNKSCAASYNNSKSPKRTVLENKICPKCKGRKTKDAEFCRACSKKETLEKFRNKTISQVMLKNQQITHAYSPIRSDARRFMEESGIPKACEICGHSNTVEVAHLKAIKDFDPATTLVKEVNSLNNLMYLCPNHHKEQEKGIILIDLT